MVILLSNQTSMSSAEQIVTGTPAKAETPKPSARIGALLENAIFGLLLLLALAVPFWTKAAVLLARIAWVLWLAKIVVTRRTRLAKFPLSLTLPLLAFLAATAISSAFSYEPVMSWNRMRGVAMLLLVYIVADSLRTLQQVRWIVFGLLFSTTVVAIYTCLQFAFSSAHPARAQGFFSLYIPYSEFLMLMAALNFGLLSAAFHARRRQYAWPLLAALALVLAALLLTETRAAFASLLLGVTLVVWWEGKRTTRILSLVALAAAIGLGSLWFHHARANQGWFQRDDPGTQYRVLMWEDGIRLAGQHPWTGVGMDSIYRHWQEFGLRAYEKYPWLRSHFHSSYIQIAVECGLPALAAWLWLMATYLLFLFRWARPRPETSNWFLRGLAMGLLAGTIAFLAVATVHYIIGDSEVTVMFWLLVGLALSLPSRGFQISF